MKTRPWLVVVLGGLALAACGGGGGSGKGGATGNPGPIGGSTGGTPGLLGGHGGSLDGGASSGPVDGGGTSPGTGIQSCAWLAGCLGADDCVTQACFDGCYAQASSAAQAQYDAVLTCVLTQACATSDCASVACAAELGACAGASMPDAGAPGSPQDAGLPLFPDDAPVAPKADAGVDALADLGAVNVTDAATPDTSGQGAGYTTSGSCDVVFTIPGLYESHTCWDYTLTVTTNHNDGTEHYVAYTATDAPNTQSSCTSQSYSAQQPGPWDSAAISASNLSHKKDACTLAGAGGATVVWTEGGACSLAGSLGHCTDAVTNTWDPSTQMLSSALVGAWSVP